MESRNYLDRIDFKGPKNTKFEIRRFKNDEVNNSIKENKDAATLLNSRLQRYRDDGTIDTAHIVLQVNVNTEEMEVVKEYLKQRNIQYTEHRNPKDLEYTDEYLKEMETLRKKYNFKNNNNKGTGYVLVD